MLVTGSIETLRTKVRQARRKGRSVGFVPTMGALHDGHLALIKQSREDNDLTVTSIFVNPKQFAPGEDFGRYPRPKKNDVLLAKESGVDIIFYPSVKKVYPTRYLTNVEVSQIDRVLCGKIRPGHFRGVATIVAKLLNIVEPDTLYLGQKDAQQCVVIKQMIKDLNFPVKVKTVATVREKDGLALSSRNKYLSRRQRQEAPVLYQSLLLAKKLILAGERSTRVVRQRIVSNIRRKTHGRIDYVECVSADSLETLPVLRGRILIAIAVRFGSARLIDNITVNIKD